MKKLLLCTVFAVLPAVAFAAPPLDTARLKADVKTLSSDAFEGRGPATAGEVKTVEYISTQMKAAGLEPGGDLKGGKRAWTQDVPLAKSDIVGTPSISLTIGGLSKPLRQGDDVALRANMRGESHVSVKDAPVVFVGYGVKAPEKNWDDFKGMDLKGKIALVLVNDPDFETGQGDFGGKAMTYYGRWTYKYEEAARQGAVGFIVIHETAPASYGWATVKNSNTNTMFDVMRKNPGDTHAPVEGWIQRDLTVDLFKQAGLDFEALKKSAQTRDFKP
ncbi:MAG: PA domain-containing protein, partial [Caulobacter sp.]